MVLVRSRVFLFFSFIFCLGTRIRDLSFPWGRRGVGVGSAGPIVCLGFLKRGGIALFLEGELFSFATFFVDGGRDGLVLVLVMYVVRLDRINGLGRDVRVLVRFLGLF